MEAKGEDISPVGAAKAEAKGDEEAKGSRPHTADSGAAAADLSGLSEEELLAKLQEELKRPEYKLLFRLDAHLLDALPSNFMKRAVVKDFLDLFGVVSDLIGEHWELWTNRAILQYRTTGSSKDDWRTVNHSMNFNGVEVMYLRLVDHDTLVATHEGGEDDILMIRQEINKVIATRKAEAEAQMSEEQHLRRIWGGKLPQGPQEMKLAKQMLKDEAIAAEKVARDIKRGRAGGRRDDQLRQTREAAAEHTAQVDAVLRVHRKNVKAAFKASEGLLEDMEDAQDAAERRRRDIQAKQRTWTAVLGDAETSTFEQLPSFCVVKAGLTTPDEPLQIFPVRATSYIDNEMGVHWNLMNVEEEMARHSNYKDGELFLRVIALEAPTGGEPAKLGFLSSQHVGQTEGPQPGKPLGGTPMEWIFPVTVLREWLESERKRLRLAKGQKEPEQSAPKAEESRDNALEMLLGNMPMVKDEKKEEEEKEKEKKPRTPGKKGKRRQGKKEEKPKFVRRVLNVEKEHAVPLRLTAHALGQESMTWVSDYRVRLAEQDWSRKLSQVIRDRDAKDPKKVAVPCNYIYHFNGR